MTRLGLGPGILRELEQDSACICAQKLLHGFLVRQKPKRSFQNRLAPSLPAAN